VSSKLTVLRNQFPKFKPAVGDVVELRVLGIVVRTEAEVVDVTRYHEEALSEYMPGDIQTDVLLTNVVEATQ